MSFKYTPNTLKKLEELFDEARYIIRYEKGNFTLPDITVEQMKERVKGKLKEMGFPGFIAGFFTRGIPKLERWKGK